MPSLLVVVRVIIDGQSHECQPDVSILAALRQSGIQILALCHDDRLKPTGTCRSCLVRVEGTAHLVPACTTRIADGMVIEAKTPELEDYRRSLTTFLERRRGEDVVEDRSHPYIAVDMSRCIDCYRCVRICDEVQGERVWHVRDRGVETRIVPDGPTLRESSCVSCGACVDTCPTGALTDARVFSTGPPTGWTRTVCPYCGVGCELSVGTGGGHVVSVHPVPDAPVNKGHLCVKGRYAFEFLEAPDRVTQPMIREPGRWRRVPWSEARAFVARRLRELVSRYGADAFGMLGSARATNEDNYLTQKFARVVVGTNNVDCCARVCHAPSATALTAMLGSGLGTNSFDDIEAARTILVCGANATEDHPVVGARIRQAARHGAALIVIDPRRIDLAEEAACHLAIRPGTNVALLNAMAHTILTEGLADGTFLDRRVDDVEAFRRFVEDWPASRAARICEVDEDAIRHAARIYAAGRPAMSFHGLGLTEHVQGTDGVMALINLALLTGNIGVPGGGVNPLRGQNNVQGAAHMGCEPGLLPGSTPIDVGREAAERLWGTPLPRTRGLNLLEMMDAAAAGRLKGLWAIGYDLFLTNANATETARALRSLDLVIVQDLFLNETAREFGSVFLPACASFEKDGTFMNAERRIQRVRAAVAPAGRSRPDWHIIAEIARAMGHDGFGFRSAREIWDDVRTLAAGARGMTYERLEQGGLQWPCPSEDHPGTPILHVDTFAGRPRAALRRVDYQPTPERVTPAYPLLLITGRSLFQFNAGTMTGRTANNDLRPSDVLDISPADANAAALHDGDRVRIVSEYGSATLPVRVSASVAPGRLFATFQTKEIFLNAVTGPHRDRLTATPEYKVTAVRIERAAA